MKARLNRLSFNLSIFLWLVFLLNSFTKGAIILREYLFYFCLVGAICTFILSIIGLKDVKNGIFALKSVAAIFLCLVLIIFVGMILLAGNLLS